MTVSLLTVGCSSQGPSSEGPDRTVSAASQSQEQADPEEGSVAQRTPEVLEAEQAFQAMSNPDPDAWEAGYEKLQEIGAPALPVLLKGLESDALDERTNASSVFAAFGPAAEPVAEDLIAALEDQSQFVRSNLATTLLQMPDHVDQAVPVFVEILLGEGDELRPSAATNLASVEPEKLLPFVPKLIAALDDGNQIVVLHVAQLLGHVGPEAADALPKLRAIKSKADDELQTAITAAIQLIEPTSQQE